MIQYPSSTNYLNSVASTGVLTDAQNQEKIKETLKKTEDNTAVKAASNTGQNPKVLLWTIGFTAAIKAIMTPVNKLMGGEYEKSMLGKIANFGDRLAKRLNLQNPPHFISGLKEKASNSRFFKYFTDTYKAIPGNSMVKTMSKGTLGELATDASSVIEELNKPTNELISSIKAAGSAEARSKIITEAKGLKGVTAEIIQKIGGSETEVKEGIEALSKNLIDSGLVKTIQEGTKEETDIAAKKLIDILLKRTDTESVKISEFLFKRKINLKELANKLRGVSGNAAETGLGKMLSKNTLRTLEGLTNATAGGTAAILMQGWCFASALDAAIKAPKGKKLSTFMDEVVSNLGFYLVSALGINILYNTGGNRYRGMTKETLQEFRNIINTTNKAAKEGTITKEAYEIARKKAKALFNGASKEAAEQYEKELAEIFSKKLQGKGLRSALKNAEGIVKNSNIKWWEKPFKGIGRLLTTGMERFKPIMDTSGKEAGKVALNGLKKVKHFLGGFPGGAMRFALVLMAITPILVKPITAISRKIFGEPVKPEEENAKSDKKETAQTAGTTAPNVSGNYIDILSQKASQQVTQTKTTQVNTNGIAMLKQATQTIPSEVAPAAAIATTTVTQPEPETEPIATSQIKGSNPKRSYVPSAEPSEFKNDNNEKSPELEALLKQSEAIEKKVSKQLG